MNSRLSIATWVMWLALPLIAFDYWLVWDRLPARMAVHFNSAWHANGWAPREGSFEFAILIVFFMLAVLTVVNVAVRRSSAPEFMPWLMMAFSYGVLILVYSVNHWVLRYNLDERTKGPFQTQTMRKKHFTQEQNYSPLLAQLRAES